MVHEAGCEFSGDGVDDGGSCPPERGDRPPSLGQCCSCGCVSMGLLRVCGRLCGPSLDLGIAYGGHNNHMALGQQRQSWEQELGHCLFDEFGVNDQHRAARESQQRLGERSSVVALCQLGFDLEHRVDNAAELG